jgi:hypothetical protein
MRSDSDTKLSDVEVEFTVCTGMVPSQTRGISSLHFS